MQPARAGVWDRRSRPLGLLEDHDRGPDEREPGDDAMPHRETLAKEDGGHQHDEERARLVEDGRAAGGAVLEARHPEQEGEVGAEEGGGKGEPLSPLRHEGAEDAR